MRRVLIILLSTLYVGCDASNSNSDVEYTNKAREYMSTGELKSASIELKNALSKNPDSPEARSLLGKLYLETGNFSGAEKELSRARQLGADEETILPVLSKVLLFQGKYNEVLKLGQDDSLNNVDAVELWAARGMAYLAKNDLLNASTELKRALAAGPDSKFALVANAGLMAQKGDLDSAYASLEKALEIDKDYALAWSYQGDLKRIQNKPEEAIQSYSKSIKARGNNGPDLLKRAMLFIQLKKFDRAAEDIAVLDRKFQNNPRLNYVKGMLAFQQRKLPEAQNYFEEVLNVDSRSERASYMLGITHLLQEHIEQSASLIAPFVANRPNYAPGVRILSLIRLKQGKNLEAENLIRTVIVRDDQDVYALNILADALLQQGKTDQAIEVLERVATLNPDSARDKLRLGASLVKGGDKEAGFQEMRSALDLDPDLQQADYLLILGYLKEKELDKARQAAESFVKRKPENNMAYNLLGITLMVQQDVMNARKAFEQATEIAPGDPTANSNLAAIALRNSEPGLAKDYFNKILDRHPGHLSTLLKLAKLEAAEGNRKAARSLLQKAVDANPESIQARVQLAMELIADGRSSAARTALGEALLNNPKNTALLRVNGEIQLAEKDFPGAKITFERLIELQPGVAHSHFLLAQALAGLNERKRMKEELETSLESNPDHVLARIALARIFLAEGNVGLAKEYADRLQGNPAIKADVMALNAGILAKSGNTQGAMAAYRELFESFPSRDSLLALTRFQWRTGQKMEAVSQLEKWLKEYPDDTLMKLELANSFMGLGRQDAAASLYTEILEHSENNLIALNNLAWYLRESDPKRALGYAERANSIKPDSLNVMDTLAVVLLKNGETARAERLIEKTLARSPDNPSFLYHQAMLLEEQGQRQESIAILESLLKAGAAFPMKDEAEQMLKRLKNGG